MCLLPIDIDTRHLGSNWAEVTPFNKGTDRFCIPLRHDLHSPIGKVSHPPDKAQGLRLPLRIHTEEDPLDAAGNEQMRSLSHYSPWRGED